MAKKVIAIDQLAVMAQRGFSDITEKMVTKQQLSDLEKNMNKRFDKIENILIEEQNRKIERLEMRIEYLENMLNVSMKKHA